MATRAELMQQLREADAAGDDAKANRIADQIDALPPETQDDGTTPVAVAEPEEGRDILVREGLDYGKSWFPEGEKFPGYTAGHNYLSGIVKGVGNLVNAVPDTVNTVQSLWDKHHGGTGELAPEDTWRQWVKGPVQGDKTLEELNPVTPGWEGTERAGRITGTALPAVALAGLTGGASAAPLLAGAVTLPAVASAGKYAGKGLDYVTGSENERWADTLEAGLPAVFGGARMVKSIPMPKLPKVSIPTKVAISQAIGPDNYLALKAATVPIKAVNKALIGKPRGGVGNEFNRLVTETGALTRDQGAEDEKERRRRKEGR